jgi:hypothetical protein
MVRKALASLAVLALAIVATLPGIAFAAGVGASPSELHFDDRQQDLPQTLSVVNTGGDESTFKVYAEGEYETWFDFSPSQFSLAPGDTETVAISMSPPPSASGEHTATICVVSFEPSTALRVGVGVKVPAHIYATRVVSPAETPSAPPTATTQTPGIQMWLVLAIVLPIVLLGIALVWRRRRGTIGAL